MVVSYQIPKDHADLVIMIQANLGLIICYVSDVEIKSLQTSGNHEVKVSYNKFVEAFLGTDLESMKVALEAKMNGCSPLKVFAAQMIVPKIQDPTIDRIVFVRLLHNDLRRNLAANSGSSKLDVPVYPYTSAPRCAMYQKLDGIDSVVSLSGFVDSTGKQSQIGQVSMSDGNFMVGDTLVAAAFQDGAPEYSVKGLILGDHIPATWKELFEKPTDWAKNIEHLDPGVDASGCKQVAWSTKGSLIYMMNNGKGPVWAIQTSVGAIMCYMSLDTWQEMFNEWKEYPIRMFQKSLAEHLLDPLRATVEDQDRAETSLLFGIQFWTMNMSIAREFSKMLSNIEAKLREYFATRETKQASEFSFQHIDPYPSKTNVNKSLKPNSAYTWMAIWQEAPRPDTLETSAWTWQVGSGSRGKKPPQWRVDLSKPTVHGESLGFGGYKHVQLSLV